MGAHGAAMCHLQEFITRIKSELLLTPIMDGWDSSSFIKWIALELVALKNHFKKYF